MYLHKEFNFADTRTRLASEGFAVKDCLIGGEKCWLIFPPNMGVEWNKDNLIYRSGIWTDLGNPVSLSWKKFFNWEEKCELAPKPKTLEECELISKEDGSTLLISKFNGELIMRTRGSSDMALLDNGYEKPILIEMYPKLFKYLEKFNNTGCTYVFEWETPSNRIVIDYGDTPRLVYTGQIWHDNYSYTSQDLLDSTAKLFNIPRPKVYNFNTFDSLFNAMKEMKGIEGICCYYNEGQDIKKLKTEEYLMLHNVKNKIGYKALIDMIYEENVEIDEFKAYIEKRFEHEGLLFINDFIENIYKFDFLIKERIDKDFQYIMNNFNPQNKKDFAAIVLNDDRYIKYSPYLFKLFESKESNINQVLKESLTLTEKFKKNILEYATSK